MGPLLVTILSAYIFDIKGNALWDATKAVWSKLTSKEWEDLFLDAFEQTLDEESVRLKQYGDGIVDLPREELRKVLHQRLSISFSDISLSELSSDQFVRNLAQALAAEESLTIGGHNLSEEDYSSLISSLIRKTNVIFKNTIARNPEKTQQALLSESQRLNVSIDEIRNYLNNRFDVILPEIRAISAATEKILSAQDTTRAENAAGFAEMKQLFLERLPLTSEDEIEKRVEEQVLHSKIDSAIELLKNGKPITAKNQLEEIANSFDEMEVSPQTRLKVLSKIGACYLDLGENEKGARFLEEGYQILPDDPKAQANASVAALISGKYENAISLARQCLIHEPTQPVALSVLLEASFRLDRMDKIDPTELQEIQLHVESRRRYAILLTEQGNLDQAENLHRLNIKSIESESQDSILLAQVLMLKVRDRRMNKVHVPWEIDFNNGNNLLEEAENLLTKVIESWKYYENRSRYHNVVVLRASIQGMLGNDELTLQNCQLVLVENPNHEDALWNGGLAAFQLNDYQTATLLLKRFAITPEKLDAAKPILAISYINQKKYQDVIQLLDNPTTYQSIELRANILRLQAEAAFKLGKIDKVNQIIAEVMEFNNESPALVETIGSLFVMVGHVENAEIYLQKAFEHANSEEQKFYAFRFAEFYFLQNQFSKAAKYYEIAEIPLTNSPYTQKYLVSLLNSGNWSKAFQLAQSIRNDGLAIPVISEVEARIAEYVDDFNLARELYEQLIKLDSSNLEHYIHLAYIELRQGLTDKVIEILEPVLEQFKNEPEFQMSAAQILANGGYPMDNVLKIAYEAQRAGIDNPQVQSAYIGLFLNREKEGDVLDPQEVMVDTAVEVDSDGQIRWFIILNVDDIDKGKGELHFEDPLAKRLMGHHVGDNFILSQNPIKPITGTIKQIQSKYVRAFQHILLNFNIDFPDEGKVVRIHFPINEPDQLVSFPMFHSDSVGIILDSYIKQKSPITIGGLGQLIGRNIIEVWEHLVGIPDGILRAATGHTQEQRTQLQLAVSAKTITLEMTAFLTMWFLDFADILNLRFEKVFFAQSLLDQLSEAINRDKQFGSDGAKFLGINKGLIQFSEIPNEQVQKRISNLEQMKTYVQEHFEVVPVRGAIELGRENHEKYEELIGRHQLDSILVARETNSLLFSDDLWLRTIANNEFEVRGLWSHTVIGDFARNGHIENAGFFEATVKMILSNYNYVAINRDMIFYALQRYEWQITKDIEKIFRTLGGPDTTEESAIIVLSNVIKEIWLGSMLIERKIAFLDLCMRSLITNRPAKRVLTRFRDNLYQELILAPLQQVEIDRQINLWIRTRTSLG